MKFVYQTLTLTLALLLSGANASAQPLVDGAWLESRLEQKNLVILDIRNGIDGGSAETFAAGHIPGALHSDYLKAGWRTTRDGIVGMLPPTSALESLIGNLGVGNESQVVLVPAGVSAVDYGSATRVYWTFKYLGHDQVSILDGGFALWRKQHRPVETGIVAATPRKFTAKVRPQLLATRDDVQAALANGGALIDNRPTPQFLGRGKHPKAARAGAIPTAHNIPQEQFFDASSGKFAAKNTLARLWRDDDLAGDESITYCNTGHWASLGWFASSELLGRTKTKLYDGSMVEWSKDQSLPMTAAGK